MSYHEPRCSGTKRCLACKQDLAVLCFATDRAHVDGLSSTCRTCKSQQEKANRKPKDRKSLKLSMDYEM